MKSFIRHVRGGKLSESQYGNRMRGTGEISAQISRLFQVFKRRSGLNGELPPYDFSRFQPPRLPSGQMRLF